MALTLVTDFDVQTRERLDVLFSHLPEGLCKVPYGRVADRRRADTLPWHVTISAWPGREKAQVLAALGRLRFEGCRMRATGVELMRGAQGSLVLYLAFGGCPELEAARREVYDLWPAPRYAPGVMPFHLTVGIDRDHAKIMRAREALTLAFRPFDLGVRALMLYKIYPAMPLLSVGCGKV